MSHGRLSNNRMQRTALRAAADAEGWASNGNMAEDGS